MARTVLLIDYYPRSISRIRTLLQSSGYRTVVAHDADQGLEEFQKATPDLTLIQDLLPKGHGYEVCRKLKDSEHGHRSPVILLTAPKGGGRRHELLQTRCDDFVEKPFTDDALMTAVRKILPGAETVPTKAARTTTQPAAVTAAPAAVPQTRVPIPVEFTADDIGAALDMILPNPSKKKEEPLKTEAKAEEVTEEPKNGKRRSLKSLLKRKGTPKSKASSKRAARKKSAGKNEGAAPNKQAAARKKRKSTKRKASRAGTSGKKVPAPA